MIQYRRQYPQLYYTFHVDSKILNPDLQLVLDDSERIRHTLQNFGPVLDEISAVCDISTHKERVNQNNQQVQIMQRKILAPLEQLLKAVGVRLLKERNFRLLVAVTDPTTFWENVLLWCDHILRFRARKTYL